MRRVNGESCTRARDLGIALLVGGVLSGACSFGTRTNPCDNGRRCGPGQICAAGQDVCIPIDGCGDGVMAGEEACDDGNITAGDGCNADCNLEICGNGVVDAGESCDDRNRTPGDGCSDACRLESKVCGNGMVDADLQEDCDAGASDTKGCDRDCTFVECGDGHPNLAADEECDAGGMITDQCNGLLCTRPECGDYFFNPAAGEKCDTGGDTPECNGALGGNVMSHCKVPACGDRYTNKSFSPIAHGPAEQCDEGAEDTMSCDFDCTLAVCGDGYLNDAAGEKCEEGATDTMGCDFDCTLPACGDGHRNGEAGEGCDDGNTNDEDACVSVSGICKVARCGDGFVRASFEQCDPPGSKCSGGLGNCDNECQCE